LEEVIITSEDNNDFQPISSSNVISINAKFAAQVPQSAEPDVFRTMQMLPGVTATNELSSGLYINGGTANQNLVLFDGIPIYHVDHFLVISVPLTLSLFKPCDCLKEDSMLNMEDELQAWLNLLARMGIQKKRVAISRLTY